MTDWGTSGRLAKKQVLTINNQSVLLTREYPPSIISMMFDDSIETSFWWSRCSRFRSAADPLTVLSTSVPLTAHQLVQVLLLLVIIGRVPSGRMPHRRLVLLRLVRWATRRFTALRFVARREFVRGKVMRCRRTLHVVQSRGGGGSGRNVGMPTGPRIRTTTWICHR